MFRLLESICYDGKGYPLLDYHQLRINKAFKEIFNSEQPLKLQEILPDHIDGTGLLKVRVLYNQTQHHIESSLYVKKSLSSLRLVFADSIDYDHKYANRSQLEMLFEQRDTADDVLIIKNGQLTDTSYANIALLKDEVWYTPLKPLLPGVRRAKLLAEGKLEATSLGPEDLHQFEQVSLFNAMIDLGEITIRIENILP